MIDKIINASVDGVKRSGALEAGCLMGTVTEVNGGTVTVERGSDTYPSVRVLSGYPNPAVGHRVEILRTAGGWVCIGKVQTAAPTIQHGSISVTTTTAAWREATVTFPAEFSSTPTVVATATSTIQAAATISLATSSISTSGFTMRVYRSNGGTNASPTNVLWIATNA